MMDFTKIYSLTQVTDVYLKKVEQELSPGGHNVERSQVWITTIHWTVLFSNIHFQILKHHNVPALLTKYHIMFNSVKSFL